MRSAFWSRIPLSFAQWGESKLPRRSRMKMRWFWILGLCALFSVGQALAQQSAKKPIPVEKLASFLKDLTGWKAEGQAEGQTMKVAEGTYTVAYRSYSQGDKGLEITLVDGAGIKQAYEDYEDLKAEASSSGPNPAKMVTVAGFPAVEIFEKESETATLMVLIKERFLLIIDLEGATAKDDLKAIANQLDLKGLASLAGS